MSNTSAARRLRLALEMYEFGERMQRARVRRQNPQATDAEVDASIRAWLVRRRTSRPGDAVGKPSNRFA